MFNGLKAMLTGNRSKVTWATREQVEAVDETEFSGPLWGEFHLRSKYQGSQTRGGINTVKLNGEFIHITDLDAQTLCSEWTKEQLIINNLYAANRKANAGWRGMVLRAIGVRLQTTKERS